MNTQEAQQERHEEIVRELDECSELGNEIVNAYCPSCEIC